MLAGTTYPVTIKRLGRFFVGFLGIWLANAAGSTWYASKTLVGSKPAAEYSNGFGNLSSILVASTEMPAANAGGTTCNLWVPGSSPGHAFTGAIAQLDRATDMFLHRSSPQARVEES
jgi:hypothetical protein